MTTRRAEGCTFVTGTLGQVWCAGGPTDRLLGATPRELARVHIGDLFSAADRRRVFAEMENAVRSGARRRLECELVGKEGAVPVALTLEPSRSGPRGTVDRWVLRCEPVNGANVGDGGGVDPAPMPAAPSHRDLDLSARAIARALRADEFDLDFQPIVDLATTRTVGYEALVRWVRPGRGRVTAGAFLPAVEDAGLMAELGRHVLERGLAQLASWGDDEDAHGITVNIAPSDLVRPGFAADVGRIVANARIDPQRLVLEFTEEALRVDAAAVADTLARLRDRAGVQLAIDDFGTLRSSLETLTLPIDVIKLDRGVTTRALASPRHRTVLAHLLDLSRAVGSIVIGEGIEEPAELEVLESLGCEYAQGYLLGRPGPAT